jgi:hypothetical protein
MLAEAQQIRLGLTDAAGRGAVSEPFDVFSRNDLLLSGSASLVVFVDAPILYHFAITNTGPGSATGARLTSTVGTNATFVAAEFSQGACFISNSVAFCDLGPMASGAVADITLRAKALTRGTVTNLATIARTDPDGYLPNNTVRLATTVMFPQVSILDVTNSEPNNGSGLMTFTLGLSAPNALVSSVAFATANGTAVAGADYTESSGVITFQPGMTNATLTIPILGDALDEANETFFVNLISATNLDIIRALGIGTILDNDSLPGVSINDVTVTETASGPITAEFNVTLDTPSGRTVTVIYNTANGTAVAGLDYVDAYGSLVFQPGQTNRTITITVLDDGFAEPGKNFSVVLPSAGNAIIKRNQGIATILDNDFAPIDHFTLEAIEGARYAGTLLPLAVTARDGLGGLASDFNEPVSLLAFESPRNITVGSSNATWALPFSSSFHDSRLQTIYASNEIGAPGSIVGLALNVVATPAQTLNGWTIRTRHHPNAHFAARIWETNGWVTNFQHNLTMVSNGWVTFPFSRPFRYNGRDHLMVDFSFDNSTFSADGLVRASDTPLPRSLYLRSDSVLGQPMDWSGSAPTGTLASRVLNVQFIMARDIAVQPSVLSNFVNGVATETITLDGAATNVVVRAVDRAGHLGDSAPFTSVALRISSVTRNGSALTIRFPTLSGSRYVIEGRRAMQTTWTATSPVLTGDGNELQFTDTAPSQQ